MTTLMSFSTLILILTSVSLSACAQLLLKIGVTATRQQAGSEVPSVFAPLQFLLHPYVLGGVALYGLGMILWLFVLARTELSQAYPFVGLGFVLTAVFGALILQEALSPIRILGTTLILAGTVLVARS